MIGLCWFIKLTNIWLLYGETEIVGSDSMGYLTQRSNMLIINKRGNCARATKGLLSAIGYFSSPWFR